MMSLGILIIRLVMGLTFAAHGTQKMFGWFKGTGLRKFAETLASINVKPPMLNAFLAALAEIIAGLFIATGVWMELGAVLVVITMLVAIMKVHGKNGYLQKGGYEYNLHLIAIAIGLAFIGPGKYVLFS
ncbi:DoxX family protein [Lederbergia sp. NSJ-179]|uniref:DoxX family protein n=1 Tax=Lederbergia sp. NSJ-179 TaxID=2931402 RepID=UPI001FD13461|nr:DoxX family protein [Lederbergia sp. NSJ-179]MCJ7840864.1 DoxX family protein [Lederbergia sp. NSJ-179]